MRYVTPLFVRSPGGRSGTSLMMEILGSSDKIAFDKIHPYESRVFSYFFRLVQLPFLEKGDRFLFRNDCLVSGPQNVMGPLPIKTAIFDGDPAAQNELLKSMWGCLSGLIHQKDSGVKYYAEKIPHDIPGKILGSLPFKCILLIRDPRDELLSIVNFNKKRGVNGFGWRSDDDFESFFERFLSIRANYFSLVAHNPYNGLVVRYEDLVNARKEVLAKLADYLDIDFIQDEQSDIRLFRKDHMTSVTPELSIGKWKLDLAEEYSARITDRIGSNLERFGYS